MDDLEQQIADYLRQLSDRDNGYFESPLIIQDRDFPVIHLITSPPKRSITSD